MGILVNPVCSTTSYTHTKHNHPEQIRRIAEDMTQMQELYELDFAVEIFQKIADELEKSLKQDFFEDA